MATHISRITSTLGVVEAEAAPDVLIVVVGSYSDLGGVPGSFSVGSMDFNNSNTETLIVTNITAIPEAKALNGMTTIKESPHIVHITDSSIGAILRVKIKSGEYSKAIEHVFVTNCTGNFSLAINGIRTYNGTLSFTKPAQQLYGRIPINSTGRATAEPEIIARPSSAEQAWDDFAMEWEGSSWLASHPNAVTDVALAAVLQSLLWSSRRCSSLVGALMLYVVPAGLSPREGEQTAGQTFALGTRLV